MASSPNLPSAAAVQSSLIYSIEQYPDEPQSAGMSTLPIGSPTDAGTSMQTMSMPAMQTHPLGNQFVYTPHPQQGQVVYMMEYGDGSPQLVQKQTAPMPQPTDILSQAEKQFLTPGDLNRPPSGVSLNSSGEETDLSPPLYNHPGGLFSPSLEDPDDDRKLPLHLDFSYLSSRDDDPSREQHNMKERQRRARIKEACELMRRLLPGLSDKTDKATVFEFAARYIHFLKGFVGSQHDKVMKRKANQRDKSI